MSTLFLQLIYSVGLTLAAAAILFPVMIKLSPKLGLVDIPNYRKFHRQPVPAIGGLVIVLSIGVVAAFSNPLQAFIGNHLAMVAAIIVMMVTGLVDDRLNLSVKLRLLLQILCACAIGWDGALITSLHGLFGTHELPVIVQYLLTVLVVTGVTNAFNLMDGIDGLAGGMSLINIFMLAVMSIMTPGKGWLFLLLPLCAALVIFLKYNWRPAKIFMGDSGSLVFGLIISTVGINFIREAGDNGSMLTSEFIVLVTGSCMIPVLDAVRVFYSRIKKGKSPFHPDRTHLHHLLTKHYQVHSRATNKIIRLHISILITSFVAAAFLNVYWVIVMQVVGVALYMNFLRMMSYFYRWYRVIKKMELAP